MSLFRQTCLVAFAGVCLLGGMGPVHAQLRLRANPDEEPQWATLRLDRIYTGVYAEAFAQETTIDGSSSYENTRTFVGPLIGVGASGSIYHPNLISYRLDVDGSYGFTREEFTSGGVSTATDETQFLGWFSGQMHVLDSKPLNGRLYANYNHTYHDYDFFNRIYVNTWNYGGSAFYSSGPWRFSTRLDRFTEEAESTTLPRTSDTKSVSFAVSHSRSIGNTAFTSSLSDYDRNDSGYKSSGRNYLFAVSDIEDFGDRKQYHSLLNLSYNHIEPVNLPNDLLTAMGSLRVEHAENLDSQHQMSYSHSSYEDADNESLSGSSSLRHQLFDSLTSTFTVQGYNYSASAGVSRQDSWQVGAGPGFNYTKRLSDSSSLSAYESFSLYHTEVQSSGDRVTVNSEPQSFNSPGSGGFFTLRQPNVIESTIVISSGPNSSGTIYDPVADGYEVIPNGQLTRIQRLPGSTMPDSVFVRYDFNPGSPGEYDTLNNACGLRVDFFNQLWGVYTRYVLNQNSGDPGVVVQDLNDFVIGTDVNWRFLRAGAEFEMYDSSLAPYEALRFFQNFNFAPHERASLGINFTETFVNYDLAGRNEQNYRATLRYNYRFGNHVRMSLDLGGHRRVGEGVDQTMGLCRPELGYTLGDFSASLGYELGYNAYMNRQENLRNRAYIRLRKAF